MEKVRKRMGTEERRLRNRWSKIREEGSGNNKHEREMEVKGKRRKKSVCVCAR